jgi:hypothetical protein
MRFTSPVALLALLFLPGIIYLGWPARGSGRKREIASLVVRCALVLLFSPGRDGADHLDQ